MRRPGQIGALAEIRIRRANSMKVFAVAIFRELENGN
jgi:hypothetical protein